MERVFNWTPWESASRLPPGDKKGFVGRKLTALLMLASLAKFGKLLISFFFLLFPSLGGEGEIGLRMCASLLAAVLWYN